MDWCGDDLTNATEQHTEFSNALNATGRPIWLELCRGYDYPPPPYVAKVANSWRVTVCITHTHTTHNTERYIYIVCTLYTNANQGDHSDDWSSTANAIEKVAGQTGMSGKNNWAYNDFLMTGVFTMYGTWVTVGGEKGM